MKKKFSFKTWLSKIVIMLITVSVIQWPVPAYAGNAVSINAVSNNAVSGNSASEDKVPVSIVSKNTLSEAAAVTVQPEAALQSAASIQSAAQVQAAGAVKQRINSVVLTQIMGDGTDGESYTIYASEFEQAKTMNDTGIKYVNHKFSRYCMSLRVTINVPAELEGSTEYIFNRYYYTYGGHSSGRIKDKTHECKYYGEYKLTAIDTATGDEASYFIINSCADLTRPVIDSVKFTPKGTVINGKSAAGYIDVTAHDADTGMKENGYGCDWVWNNTGHFEVTHNKKYPIMVFDRSGNNQESSCEVTSIDSSAPDINVTEISSGAVNGFVRSSSLSLTAADDTGLDSMPYCFGEDGAWTNTNRFSITANGIYKTKARDVFGHEAVKYINVTDIDTSAPVIDSNEFRMTLSRNGFSKKAELVMHVSDKEAGLAEKPYSFDGGKTWQSEDHISISENTAVSFAARDIFGNTSSVMSIPVNCIDRDAPVIRDVSVKPQVTAGKYCAKAKVTFMAEDGKSGLSDNFVSADGGKTWQNVFSYTMSRNGSYVLRVRDGAGNTSESTFEVSGIDAAAPECTITGNPTSATIGKILLKVNASDFESGLKDISVMDGKLGIQSSVKVFVAEEDGRGPENGAAEVPVTKNGEYVFVITDACGNEARVTEKVTNIVRKPDEKKPEDTGTDDEKPEDRKKDDNVPKDEVKKPEDKEKNTVVIKPGQKDSTETDRKAGHASGDSVKTINIRGAGQSTEEKKENERSRTVSRNSVFSVTGMQSGRDSVSEDENINDEANTAKTEEAEETYAEATEPEDIFADEDGSEADTAEHLLKENAASEMAAAEQMLAAKDSTGQDKGSKTVPVLVTVIILMASLGIFAVFILYRKGLIGEIQE